MYTIEEIKNRISFVHGDKYVYDFSTYVKFSEKMRIICPEHGEFWQSLHQHINKKQGCPLCGINSRAAERLYTSEEFIKKAREIHGDKYIYDKVNYVNSITKVEIICKIHGSFFQRPDSHLCGKGCKHCNNKTIETKRVNSSKMSKEDFLKKCTDKFNNKYSYDLTLYKNLSSKIIVNCPKHGKFEQVASCHLNSKTGCPKCSYEVDNTRKLSDTLTFIEKAKKVHGDKYDYSNVKYSSVNDKVQIICPIHGEFDQKPSNHLSGNGCPICGIINNGTSDGENTFFEFIKSIYKGNIIRNDRTILIGQEIDILLPDEKIGFEYNGLYWHSELKKEKKYHINKTNECLKNGIQLIHIFEDEWINKKEICKSRIKNILKISDTKIYARKCIVKEISSKLCSDFNKKNHIQGNVRGVKYLGLYYNDELVSIMSFGSKRKNLGSSHVENEYELLRFCNKLNTNVVGGAGKLLKFFIDKYKPSKIISYCDRRWSNGNLYEKIGFKLHHISSPNYFYIINNERKNRFNYRKDILIKKYGCKNEQTEHEFCFNQGWYRIYDCGTYVYEMIL